MQTTITRRQFDTLKLAVSIIRRHEACPKSWKSTVQTSDDYDLCPRALSALDRAGLLHECGDALSRKRYAIALMVNSRIDAAISGATFTKSHARLAF